MALEFDEEVKDGRRRRSEESRARIIRAMLRLLAEGDVAPSAEAVAERASVGLRTVFRHFENMDSLYQEINDQIRAEVRPIYERPFASAGGRPRVEEIIDRRIAIYERIMPLKIAADVHRHRSAFLAARSTELIREQRQALKVKLGPEFNADADLFETLDLLLSFDAWRRLRREQRLGRARARQIVRRAVMAVLDGEAPVEAAPPAEEGDAA